MTGLATSGRSFFLAPNAATEGGTFQNPELNWVILLLHHMQKIETSEELTWKHGRNLCSPNWVIIYNGILFGRKRSGPPTSCHLLNTLFLCTMYKRMIAVCEPCDVNGVINCRTFAWGYKDCGQCPPLVAHFKHGQKIYCCWYIWENNWLPWLQRNYSSFNHQWNQNHSLQLAGWYSLPPVMTDL